MNPIPKKAPYESDKSEMHLLRQLDKAIDSMEQGRTVSHERAMEIIRERVQKYNV